MKKTTWFSLQARNNHKKKEKLLPKLTNYLLHFRNVQLIERSYELFIFDESPHISLKCQRKPSSTTATKMTKKISFSFIIFFSFWRVCASSRMFEDFYPWYVYVWVLIHSRPPGCSTISIYFQHLYSMINRFSVYEILHFSSN